MEEACGTALFERRARGMILTQAGEMLANHARRTLLDAHHVASDIRSLTQTGKTQIRLACTEGFAREFLPSVIASFLNEQPGFHFTLQVGSPSFVTNLVMEGDVDIGLTFSLVHDAKVHIQFTTRAPVYAVLVKHHPLANYDTLTLQDIVNYPMAIASEGTTVRFLLDMCCAMEKLTPNVVFAGNSSASIHNFALATGAITLASRITVQQSIANGAVVAIPLSNPELQQRTIQVQTLMGRILPPVVQTFCDRLIAQLEAE